MAEFRYDVAFSLLGQDEAIARKLNDLLQGRITTFIWLPKSIESPNRTKSNKQRGTG